MNNDQRMAEIRSRLEQALGPEHIDVIDESHEHIGHEGARDGRGHFRVLIISDRFEGKLPIQRHRLVYGAVGDLMQTDIHALAIEAWTPDEL